MITLGIDPGLSGAFALLFETKQMVIPDMPTFETLRANNKTKREIDVAAALSIMETLAAHAPQLFLGDSNPDVI